MTVEESIVVPRPPEEVWAVVDDLERAPEWQGSLESVDVERGIEVRSVAGHRRDARFEVVERDPPRVLRIVSRSGSVTADAMFTLAPEGEGTRVAIRIDLDLGGGGRMLGALVRGRATREAKADLERLRAVLA